MSPRHLRPPTPSRRPVAPLHRGPQANTLSASMSSNVVGGAQPHQAPNAAMLIDFDNVTMGIRSDLQEELKNLLSSDIIKGKVAVRRAYADWRRYPQYIVPLTEASIDLIFAPAYGSAKKNATDIRLAIDALELVFTRPEIGTFVLLSGDSDFSSMVIKLKEYGKYVIGVGIRESSSDLLVMNCDEYYSYNALAGLVRSGDEESTRWDPYELVTEAVQRMKRNGDVMRSDRLKQVMQEIDASFDEKNLGMPKFSRFVQEAQSRGLLSVTKLENGQMEIGLPVGTPATIEAVPAAAADKTEGDEGEERGTPAEREERRSRRGRRGRGRDRDREERPRSATAVANAESSDAAGTADADADVASITAEPSVPAASTSPSAPAAARAAPAVAADAPLGAVARVGSVSPSVSRAPAPSAAAKPALSGDVPLGAVARVGSVVAPSATASAAPAVAAAAPPLGAVARVGEQTERPAREDRNDRGRGRGRDRDRGPRTDAPRSDVQRTDTAPAAVNGQADTIGVSGEKLTRAEAFDLVQRAVTALVSGNNTTSALKVREKAFELLGRDSETLAARMFERILRDAHDADVIDLRRRGDDYEVGRVAEAASIADQLAKKEAELVQVKKDADKASGASGPTGLGTRGRMAGRGGRMGGRAGGAPPELLMVGVVKSATSAPTAAAPVVAAVAAPVASPVVEAAPVAAAASAEAAPDATPAESTKPARKASPKSATKTAPKTAAKKAAKTAPRTSTKAASSKASAKAQPKAPAKAAAKTAAKTAVKPATKSAAKSSSKSAAPAKKAARKTAKKAST